MSTVQAQAGDTTGSVTTRKGCANLQGSVAASDTTPPTVVAGAQGVPHQADNPDTTTAASANGDGITTFGPYTAHPVANLFPLMRDTDREGFSGLITDIRDDGLIDPIVLDGNVLLDGRNRYLACIEAEVEPRFVQFKDLGLSISPHVYAFQRNQSRRSLTPEQRVTITAAYFRFSEEEVKRQRATAGGKAGGRGRPKQLVTESSQAMPKPKRAKTTRAKLAEATGVSEHKAQQAINVVQHGSAETVQAVIAGKVKLKDVAQTPAPLVTDAGAWLGLSEAPATSKKSKVPGSARPDQVVLTLHRFITLLTRMDPMLAAQAVPLVDVNRVQSSLVELNAWTNSFVSNLNTGPEAGA